MASQANRGSKSSSKAQARSAGARTTSEKSGRASAPAKAEASKKERSWLRTGEEPRSERRFVPKAAASMLLGVLATSLGAILLGAGVWGRFLRTAGPHEHAVLLLGGGAILFVIGMLSAGRSAPTLRIGDGGLGMEKDDGSVERLYWHDVETIRFAQNILTFSGTGHLVVLPLATLPEAAALALAEARRRIPHRAEAISESLPEPAADAGERVVLEPPQLAGSRCASSDRLISFEKDGRLCGRCGQVYHREEVPRRCVSCDASLG